jgi:hypothetical protein
MNFLIFAYVGPETALPLMSTLAAVAGIALTFGRSTIAFAKKCVRQFLK